MSEALAEIREGFSKKEIKMAIGVASDPRYKQGNYTGAVNAIEKIKKGLSKHPQVAAVLKRQNEKLDQEDEPFVKDLVKNLRKGSATHSKQADDLEKAVKEDVELDEDKISKKGGQLQRVINSIVVLMKKDPKMKKHAMEFEKDAKKTEDPRKSLDNVTDLPFGNYAVGDEIGDILNKNEPIGHMVGRGKVTPVYKNKNPRARVNENVELDEKYDLYHKTFSDAMQHAYDYAKKKLGITVDPKEIDNKVATGPRKPSEGKTNKYRLKGKGGNLQIQVYNKGGSKPFELNMYKEEVELDEKVEYVEYKFKNKNDAMAAKKMLDGIQLMSFDINDDNISGGELAVDANSKDMTKYHKEIMKKFRPKVVTQESLDEGTWAVPETPAQKRDLKKIMKSPLKLGKEGDNAADKMYSIIGDDELFDDLYVAGKKDPEGDARPIIKKAMKRLKIKEDRWFDRDSWKLDESTKPDHIKVFNSLKKGDKVEINYDSSIAGGSTKTFVIKTKNKVYKGKVDKVTMYPDGKTGGVKFHLYQYDNRPGVYMAIGDMGASMRDIKKI